MLKPLTPKGALRRPVEPHFDASDPASSPNTSQSQSTSASAKRVRLEVNGRYAVPGSFESVRTDISSYASYVPETIPSANSSQSGLRPLSSTSPPVHSGSSRATSPDGSDAESEGEKRRPGRRAKLSAEERKERRQERNRVAAAARRKEQQTKLEIMEQQNSLLMKEKRALEFKMETLEMKMGSLQRYIYDLEDALRTNNLVLPARSPTISSRRSVLEGLSDLSIGPTDSFATEATETSEVRSRSRSPSPVPHSTEILVPAQSTKIIRQPTPLAPLALAPTPVPPVAPSPTLPIVPNASDRRSPLTQWSTRDIGARASPYGFSGPVTPVSYVRDTEPFTPSSIAGSVAGSTTRSSYSTPAGLPLPLQTAPLSTPAPPTADSLQALQLELKLQETLQYMQQYGISFPLPDPPAPEFSGGDQYDTMSLSAFFNLDALDDDPNDANFEPTSPKQDSSDDESDDEGGEEAETEVDEEAPARKRRRDEEEEDLFLPIVDVPIPPPQQDMYGELMASLGLKTREELSEVVTKLFTSVNSRDQVTPQQLEALKQIMRIFQSKGGTGPSGGSGVESGGGKQKPEEQTRRKRAREM